MQCLTFLIQRQPSRRFATLLKSHYDIKLAAYFKNTFSKELLWTAASVYNFQLSVKFSTHMINSTREKIEFSCTSCFRSIALLVFALSTALRNFRFHSLRKKRDQFSSGDKVSLRFSIAV